MEGFWRCICQLVYISKYHYTKNTSPYLEKEKEDDLVEDTNKKM